MTPQEQQLLQGLTERVNQTQLTDKDPDAEKFIFEHLGRNSDSLYILAQTVLVQQYALENAKKQIDQFKLDLDHANQLAQQAQQQPVKHTSFLGSLLGTDDRPSPPSPPPPPPPAPQYQQVQTYQQPQYAPPVGYGAQQYGGGIFGGAQPQIGSQGGGFLRSAMTTAAGVAAGALAFEGIEDLMHGFGHHAGYGAGFDGGIGGGRPEEIINNNYYGDAASGNEGRGDLSDRFAAAGDHPSPDIEDRRDTFADTSNDNSADNSQFVDSDDSADSFADDSSSDDMGSFDDSGSGSDDSSS